MTDDIETIRKALQEAEAIFKGEYGLVNQYISKALAALDRIDPRVIPELPKDWEYCVVDSMGMEADDRITWRCALSEEIGNATPIFYGEGDTPRAAVLAAIESIKP